MSINSFIFSVGSNKAVFLRNVMHRKNPLFSLCVSLHIPVRHFFVSSVAC